MTARGGIDMAKDLEKAKADCRAWRVANQEKVEAYREKAKALELKREFGITPGEYDALLERQNGVCACCGKPERNGRRLAVDHCHEFEREIGEIYVRGLLCFKCNSAIGLLDDDPSLLEAGAKYLRKHLA